MNESKLVFLLNAIDERMYDALGASNADVSPLFKKKLVEARDMMAEAHSLVDEMERRNGAFTA